MKGDDILYLILFDGITVIDEETEIPTREWKFVLGRQNAYDYIRDQLLSAGETWYSINIKTSRIYVENSAVKDSKLKLSNAYDLYRFMKESLLMQKVVDDSGFNIDDYVWSDVNGEEEKE